ncbi:MAG: transferase [Pseudomonadota bacterium]
MTVADAPRAMAPERPDGASNANPADIGFWALVSEDYRTHGSAFFSQGFWALFWHRMGNWRMGVQFKLFRAPITLLYRIMFKATQILCGIELPYATPVGRRVRFDHFGGIIISARAIGDDVTIRQNTTMGIPSLKDMNAIPTIGNGVDIGAGAVIVGDISIGDGAIVGANAVVTQDIPAGAVAGGVPAKILRRH